MHYLKDSFQAFIIWSALWHAGVFCLGMVFLNSPPILPNPALTSIQLRLIGETALPKKSFDQETLNSLNKPILKQPLPLKIKKKSKTKNSLTPHLKPTSHPLPEISKSTSPPSTTFISPKEIHLGPYAERVRNAILEELKNQSLTSTRELLILEVSETGALTHLQTQSQSKSLTSKKILLAAQKASPFPKLPEGTKRIKIVVPIEIE